MKKRFAPPYTDNQKANIRGMALYWQEVSRRENQDVLYDELRQAVRMLGVLRILQAIANDAAAEEAPNA